MDQLLQSILNPKRKKTYINITSASIELKICFSLISEICKKKIIVKQRLRKTLGINKLLKLPDKLMSA